MLVIRLSRKGRSNHPMYRITVAENSKPTDGKFVEIVGNYNPTALDQPLVIQKDRVEYWISKGAQPTNTVAKLLNKQGFSLSVTEYNKAPKKKAKAVAEKGASSAPVKEEKPAEEVATEEVVEEKTGEETIEDSGVAPEAPQNDGGKEATEEATEEATAEEPTADPPSHEATEGLSGAEN